ncbi:MAG: acyl-CoA dehydrogenase family protein, partial [Deltaproteobacteria bacterium]
YAKQRVQFGRPIAKRQFIQGMIADMATDIRAARLMVYDVAQAMETGQDQAAEAAMAKLFASEAAGRAADCAVQIHGGMGYMRECVVERFYRDVRLLRIVEGTSEMQRMIIARPYVS